MAYLVTTRRKPQGKTQTKAQDKHPRTQDGRGRAEDLEGDFHFLPNAECCLSCMRTEILSKIKININSVLDLIQTILSKTNKAPMEEEKKHKRQKKGKKKAKKKQTSR